jgi:hypothetical protein
LSPIVTGGLPTPGPLLAEVDVLAVVAAGVELELLDDDVLLLPHAARPTQSAISANAARTFVLGVLGVLDLLNLLDLLALIRRLLVSDIVDRIYNNDLGYAAAAPAAIASARSRSTMRRPRGVSAR